MAKNSESKVVSIVRAYRQQLDRNERSMLYDLAGKWQLVQDSLQADLIQLAYTAVLMSESGKPVPPHILYGMKEYESFLIEAKEQFDRYNLAAENIIRGTQRINFELGLANANDALGALEIGIDWKSLNVEAFESMIGLTSAGSPLDDLLSADYGDSVRGISNALTMGIARGEGIEKIVKRMTQAANIGFDRSTRIARTEVNRAYRMATHAQYRESGVVVGFRRLVYKPTACFACLMLDGEYSDITKELEDHVMGKCTSVPCLRKNDRIEWETGREWFEKLDPEEQRRIMGAGRYEAWKDGKIKDLRQFVTIKPNPIWGGSPTILSLKELSLPTADEREMFQRYSEKMGKYLDYSLDEFIRIKRDGGIDWERVQWDYKFIEKYGATAKHPPLKNWDKAFGIIEKLTTYTFNPDHEVGRHKGIVFESALGYSLSTVKKFSDEIVHRLPDFRATLKSQTIYGDKYEVRMLVDGIGAKKQGIITVWMFDMENDQMNGYPRCANVLFEKISKRKPKRP